MALRFRKSIKLGPSQTLLETSTITSAVKSEYYFRSKLLTGYRLTASLVTHYGDLNAVENLAEILLLKVSG
jgi:hypothetical protein